MPGVNDQIKEPWLFLLGTPPIEEFMGFLVQSSGGQDTDLAVAAARWRASADLTAQLALTETGSADNQAVLPLPIEHEDRAAAFLSSPEVSSSYLTSTPTLALVPLDGLVVFQRQVNLRYTSELLESIGSGSPMESPEMFDFCTSQNQPQPSINGIQSTQNSFVFSSSSTDARFLGARLLDADHIAGYTPMGIPISAVVLYIGYGVNAINVIRINGRLVLNNGSHRAYALKASGATHAIAVVQEIARPEELSMIPAVQQNPALYLEAARPPMLRDYFNPALTETIEAPRRLRQIRVQFGMDALDAPG